MDKKIFDTAKKKPVRIKKDDKSYILINEKDFLSQQEELISLRKNFKSVLQVLDGKSKSFKNSEECIDSLFKDLKK